MTPNELIAKCIEESMLSSEQVADLPTNTRYGQADSVWVVKEQAPGVPGMLVFAIFEGNQRDMLDVHLRGDVRIFCIPTTVGIPYCRVTLSRSAPTLLRTDFKDSDAFAREVAGEWDALALAIGMIEDDTDNVVCEECGAETSITTDDDDEDDEPKYCGHCGRLFPEEIGETGEPKAGDQTQ